MQPIYGLTSDARFPAEFAERLSVLGRVLSTAPHPIRPILSDIHQSAILLNRLLEAIDITTPLPATHFDELSCFDCGTYRMDVFHTSKQGGYHLCPACFQHRVRTGRARTAH